MTEEQRQYNKEYYQKHKEEIKEKKQKSTTYYVLRTPGKEDLKFKKYKDAQLYSFLHHDDYLTYSIHKINIITKEELVESSEDDKIQALYKMEEKE